MGKFNFKYESIKSVKEVIEKKAQKDLALVDKAINTKIEEISDLINHKKIEEEKFSAKRKVLVHEVQWFEKYISSLEKKKKNLEKELENLKKVRNQKQEDLAKKGKEVKIFEKLKESHQLSYIKEQNKEEQIEIDDIATKRFIRNGKQ